MNKNKTVYKIIISIVFGLMGFGANFIVINYYFYPYTATILLGLLFPLLITLVWGWKYGLLSALFGGCQSMWWIWGPSNGYAIFFVVPTFTFWIIWHGYFADLRKKQKHYKWWMNTYIIEIPFRIFSTLNLYTFSRWAITMNPPSWGWAAQSSNVIPMNFSNFVVIKQAIVAYVLLLITSILLNINVIRKFFKLKISTANFKTNYIISFSLLISVCFWIIDSIIGALTFYADRSFIDLLVTNIPPYTLYMRTALMLACLIGGIVASRLLKQQYENKERFDFAIKGTNAGVWDWNIQTGELIFNKRWAEIIGYSLNELQPISIQTWINAVHPDDLQKSNQLLEDHYKDKSDFYTCEIRMKHKNGDWIWVLDCGKVIEWIKANKPARMIGTHIDITNLKKAEQEIKEREEDLRITLNSIGDAVIATNIYGNITRINPVAQSLTGWNLEQALGKPISDVFNIINAQTHEIAENPIQRVIEKGKIV
ncbi:PAS domain-containing protein, partial [candidate division WOR-3 bacterium]|nr:PAS domain-containing protein [candidate division WOR-3 bacterium]